MRALTRLLSLTAVATLGLAAPAMASVVEMKDGTTYTSDRLHYTYTHLVIITVDNDMRLVPNEAVKAIDGVPFHRAYWEERPGHLDSTGLGGPGGRNAPARMTATLDKLMPLKPGTFRRYDLEQVRTTWTRRGTTMVRRETVEADGQVSENVTGPAEGTAGVSLVEKITEKTPGQPVHEVELRHAIEGRPDGYYLVNQAMTDEGLSPRTQKDDISEPPRLWPQELAVGQTWIVGPFSRMGLGQVSKMEVVGVEPVTVPAGNYAQAFKVVGRGNVFGGTQMLKNGRLVTDHGTVETTTWIVPGVGAVRELSKIHLHQDFFPTGSKSEIPLVVEEEATRTLAEFHLGQ